MSEPLKIYDVATDEERDATQRDLDRLTGYCAAAGLTIRKLREIAKNAREHGLSLPAPIIEELLIGYDQQRAAVVERNK